MVPSASRMPARYISASASMMPEPQMPVTPVAAVASANPSSSDQRSQPMTLTLASSVSAVDADPLDGAGAARWPAVDLRALEGRARGRGRGQQALPVAEHDLGIGADVDDQHRFVRAVRRFGEHDARRVGPHVARDAGQHVDPATGVDVEVDVACLQVEPVRPREREGGAAQLGRIDAEQQVVHDRVADEGGVQNVARSMPASSATAPISAFTAPRTASVSSASPPGFIMT